MDGENKTRIDIAVGGIMLLFELGEISEEETCLTLDTVLNTYPDFIKNDNNTYYLKAKKETLAKGFII